MRPDTLQSNDVVAADDPDSPRPDDREILSDAHRQSPIALVFIAWRFVRRLGTVNLILAAVFGAINDTLGGLVLLIGYLAAIVFQFYNLYYLQGTTGQSIGKKQQGITLLKSDTGQPVGGWMAFAFLSAVSPIWAVTTWIITRR